MPQKQFERLPSASLPIFHPICCSLRLEPFFSSLPTIALIELGSKTLAAVYTRTENLQTETDFHTLPDLSHQNLSFPENKHAFFSEIRLHEFPPLKASFV